MTTLPEIANVTTDKTLTDDQLSAAAKVEEVQRLVEARREDLTEARSAFEETEHALLTGDESVTPEAWALVQATVDRADKLHTAAIHQLSAAKRKASVVDTRLAEIVGDLLSAKLGIPAIVSDKFPETSPAKSKLPLLWVVQPNGAMNVATYRNGTGLLSGTVQVRLYGRSVVEVLPANEVMVKTLNNGGVDSSATRRGDLLELRVTMGAPRLPEVPGFVPENDACGTYLAALALSIVRFKRLSDPSFDEVSIKAGTSNLVDRDFLEDGIVVETHAVTLKGEAVGPRASLLLEVAEAACKRVNSSHPFGTYYPFGYRLRATLDHSPLSNGDEEQKLNLTATLVYRSET